MWTPEYAMLCDNRPECFNMEDECVSTCGPLPKYCSQRTPSGLYTCPEGRILPGRLVCNGRKDCQSGFDELNCINRFYCKKPGEHVVSVHRDEVCDFVKHCDDASDEMNCTLTHFYCEEGKHPVYIPRQQVMDGKRDCSSGSDECPQKLFNDSIFSSHQFLIRQPFLQVMIWLMGLVAVVGNISVIINTVIKLSKFNHTKMSRIAMINNFLIINLAVADLLMGIFLLFLAVKNSLTSYSYCQYDRSWRSSFTCKILGIIAVLSAEISLSTLVILASYRLYCVVKPVESRSAKFEKSIFHIILTWVIGIFFALLPLFSQCENYFVTHLWVQGNPYFRGDVVSKESLIKFCKTFAFYNTSRLNYNAYAKDKQNCEQWNNIIKSLRSSYPIPQIRGKFGYYSVHATCLPKLFQTPSEQSWKFSFAIIFFNFSECVFIAVAYFMLWRIRRVNKSGICSESNRSLQRRIALLVCSNCACWLPICTIAFICYAGVTVNSTVYAFTAIILFPINSALNPVFYSNIFSLLWNKLFNFLRKFEAVNKLLDFCPNKRKKTSAARAPATETPLLPRSPLGTESSRLVTEITTTFIDLSSLPSSEI